MFTFVKFALGELLQSKKHLPNNVNAWVDATEAYQRTIEKICLNG